MVKKYPTYKHSGIEWIGEIPEHWEVTKCKYILESRNTERIPLSAEERGKINNKEFDYYGASGVIDKVDKFLFEGEYILIGEDGANILTRSKRLAFIARGKFWVNNHAHILRPIKGDIRYLCELLELHDYTTSVSGSAQPKLTQEALLSIPFISPPKQEQTAIATYLDRKTAEIDTLIENKQQLIQLYKEEHTATINQAVTKGLDPNVPMKDSGIEWLGEIPEHWCISKFKHEILLKARLGWKGLKADEYILIPEYGFLSTPNIKGDNIDFENINYITKERYDESPEIMLQENDVLLAKDGSTLGIVNIVKELPIKCTVNSSIGVLRVFHEESLYPNYLRYFLESDYSQNIINRIKGGMGVPHLFQADINNFDLLIPYIHEQIAISDFLSSSCNSIQQKIDITQKEIDLLKEYKTALISEVVLGKIDVREEVENG